MLNSSDFLVIDEIGFNRFEVKKFYAENLNEMEILILSQSKELQTLIRAKQARLKQEMGKDMSMSYLQNFIQEKTANGTD
jgi:replicative DNA helicase